MYTELTSGIFRVGVRPMLPIKGVTFKMGNDIAGGKVVDKSDHSLSNELTQSYPRVTRAQSLISLCKATIAHISSTLLSGDWTLASSILGSGGLCARLRSLTRRPLLLQRRCFGMFSGIRSIILVGGPNIGSAS